MNHIVLTIKGRICGEPLKPTDHKAYIGNEICREGEIQKLHVGWYSCQKCYTALIFCRSLYKR